MTLFARTSAEGGRTVRHQPAALLPTVDDLADAVAHWGAPGRTAVVMTMGALHEGHATLIRAARERVGAKGFVVVTVFVNPLQFGAGEDLDRYPRTLDADLALAFEAGASAVFAPSVDEVYPGGEPQVRITAGPMGERLEGASRPGHFDGMLTVVAKLLHLTAPDLAFFGQKDAQQLALIRRMARDLNFPVEIVGVETVRETDGLALSSRNRYLSAGSAGRPSRCPARCSPAASGSPPRRRCARVPPRCRAPRAGPRTAPRPCRGSARPGPPPTPTRSRRPPRAAAPRPSGPRPAPSWTRRPRPSRRSPSTTWPSWTRPTSPRSPTVTTGRRSSPSPRAWGAPGSSTTSL